MAWRTRWIGGGCWGVILAAAAACEGTADDESAVDGAADSGVAGSPGAPGSGGVLGSAGSTGSGGSAAETVGQRTLLLDTSASGANVTETVTHYPLAVRLGADDVDFSAAGPDGSGLRFTQNGHPLPYEVELWDAVGRTALVWILVDEVLGATAAQELELSWGEVESSAGPVFATADGFYGVWHLNEDGNTAEGGYHDASEHGGHGTGVGLAPGSSVPARLGRGTRLENPTGQNTARWVRVSGEKASAYNPDGPLTVSIWALAKSYPIYSYETIFSKGDTSWSLQRVTYEPDRGYQSCLLAGSGTTYHFCIYDFEKQPLVTDEWLHFMLVLDEPSMRLYIDGELNAEGSGYSWNQGSHPLGIGNQTQFDGRRQWDGILDEARVMRAARPAAWAKLDYESQREQQTLVSWAQ
ncbi:MAG TPA: LamG-like jellyroll fold domain-containing protein [Polyangiaceae bacterium]|nr:LamG-like jellyroll fold domain-containing protein [Polyangiaceae bacterium]